MESNMDSDYLRNRGHSAPHNLSRENGSPNSRENNRDWDLGNLFFAVVSFILGAAWYFRSVWYWFYSYFARNNNTQIAYNPVWFDYRRRRFVYRNGNYNLVYIYNVI